MSLYPRLTKLEIRYLKTASHGWMTFKSPGKILKRLHKCGLIELTVVRTKSWYVVERRYWDEHAKLILKTDLHKGYWEGAWRTTWDNKFRIVSRHRTKITPRGREVLAYYAWVAIRNNKWRCH